MCWKGCPNPAELSNGYCRECHNARCRASYKKYGKRYWRYGLTYEQVEQMHADQEGRCPICTDTIDALTCHVDHDHKTGQVRALLCGPCNMGLGNFKDDPVRLEAAVRFLKGGQ